METMIIIAVCVAVFCFIAGMLVEMTLNAKELNAMRLELDSTKSILAEMQNTTILNPVEVIEINDNRISDETLFERW